MAMHCMAFGVLYALKVLFCSFRYVMPSQIVMAAVLGMLILLGICSCRFRFVWGILHTIGWVWVVVPNAFCSGFTAVYVLVFGCHS